LELKIRKKVAESCREDENVSLLSNIWFLRLGGMLLKLVNSDSRKRLGVY